jgi:hypothetical protein
MLKFRVTRHSPPVNDVQQTICQPAGSNFLATIAGPGDGSRGATRTSISACGIWSESVSKSIIVLPESSRNQGGECIPSLAKSRPTPGRGRKSAYVHGEDVSLKRPTTVKMRVWSRQLHRLKRKTETLKKKVSKGKAGNGSLRKGVN